jgi:hypothetical protein
MKKICYTVGLLTFVLFLAGTVVAAGRHDLFFVIDNSGSMRKNDPEVITKSLVSSFITQLGQSDRVGMVLFDETARLIAPLLALNTPEARQKLSEALSQVDYHGQYTNSPAAIERAVYELRTAGRRDANRWIVFLTDGIVDTGNPRLDVEKTRWLTEDLATECAELGIRIFGIAFTETADYHLIQSMAVKTGGAYFRAPQVDDIPSVFKAIKEQLDAAAAAPSGSGPAMNSSNASSGQPAASAGDAPEANSHKGIGAITLRGIWKISLPLTIIMLLLISALGLLIYRFLLEKRSRPRHYVSPQQASRDMDEPLPEAQLRAVEDAGMAHPGPYMLDQYRITIGRDPQNDIVIPQSTVSGFHATIQYVNGHFQLEDDRSTNGTYLEGRRLEPDKPVRLKSGDSIKFATFEFRFVRTDSIPVGETIMLSGSPLSTIAQAAPFREVHTDDQSVAYFKTCMEDQLKRLAELGENYKAFVGRHFEDLTVHLLKTKVANLLKTAEAGDQELNDVLYQPPISYRLCLLPIGLSEARDWFVEKYGGFLKFATQVLDQEVYHQPGCHTLCLVAYGWKKDPWATITIVPVHEKKDAVEIMAVELLTENEKQSLALEFDENGRII